MPLIGGIVKAITVGQIQQQEAKEDGEDQKDQTSTEIARVDEATGQENPGKDVVSNKTEDGSKLSGIKEAEEAKDKVETGSEAGGGKTPAAGQEGTVSTGSSGEAGKDKDQKLEPSARNTDSSTPSSGAQESTGDTRSEGTQEDTAQTVSSDGNQKAETKLEEAGAAGTSAADKPAENTTEPDLAETYTQKLLAEFKSDMKAKGYLGYNMDYKVVTDNKTMFTLGIYATVTDADGKNIERYYHLDKKTGEKIQLSDLFPEGCNYTESINAEIREQMKHEMKEDATREYYTRADIRKYGKNITYFTTIDKNQNFYLDEDGNLVIVFDEQTIAPSFMGTPRFTISSELVKTIRENKSAQESADGSQDEKASEAVSNNPKGDEQDKPETKSDGKTDGKSDVTPKGESAESTESVNSDQIATPAGKGETTSAKGSAEEVSSIALGESEESE